MLREPREISHYNGVTKTSVINRVANRCSKHAARMLVLTTLRSIHFTLIEASLQWTPLYNSQ